MIVSAEKYTRLPMIGLLLLAACGDGDGSSTPINMTTPTPTPTATSSTYQAAFDFTRDRTFSGLITASTTQTVSARTTYGDFDTTTITYTAVNQALTAFGMNIVPNMNGNTLSQTDASLIYQYSIATSGATLSIYRASPATYVSYIRDDEQVKPLAITRFALLGAPTLAAELPMTATYALTVAQIGTTPPGQSLTIDGAGKHISGAVAISLTGNTTVTNVSFEGVVDAATGRFDGQVTTGDGSYTGVFHGRLYGPAGAEIGLLFDLTDRNGLDSQGVVLGRRS